MERGAPERKPRRDPVVAGAAAGRGRRAEGAGGGPRAAGGDRRAPRPPARRGRRAEAETPASRERPAPARPTPPERAAARERAGQAVMVPLDRERVAAAPEPEAQPPERPVRQAAVGQAARRASPAGGEVAAARAAAGLGA